ncbi:MAG: T9SS type A sorting domain-containing protein [Chitinophagales bacterium]|nr:T9SS type A sorting domain-containing protein [Chitinophagales bacterium]
MKKQLLFLSCLLISVGVFGQSVSPEVIAASGDYYETANVKMSWTLGEIVTETIETDAVTLTQGFQQSNLTITSVESMKEDIVVNIYPNPTAEIINVEIPEFTGNIHLELTNTQGQVLTTQRKLPEEAVSQFNLTRLAVGTYYLKLIGEKRQNIKTFKIIKTD